MLWIQRPDDGVQIDGLVAVTRRLGPQADAMIPHIILQPETNAQHVAEARRADLHVAAEHDLDETTRGRIAVIVTAFATNLMQHAVRGVVLVGLSFVAR